MKLRNLLPMGMALCTAIPVSATEIKDISYTGEVTAQENQSTTLDMKEENENNSEDVYQTIIKEDTTNIMPLAIESEMKDITIENDPIDIEEDYNNITIDTYYVMIPKVLVMGENKECMYMILIDGTIGANEKIAVRPLDNYFWLSPVLLVAYHRIHMGSFLNYYISIQKIKRKPYRLLRKKNKNY